MVLLAVNGESQDGEDERYRRRDPEERAPKELREEGTIG
jgi:hypothetical protein